MVENRQEIRVVRDEHELTVEVKAELVSALAMVSATILEIVKLFEISAEDVLTVLRTTVNKLKEDKKGLKEESNKVEELGAPIMNWLKGKDSDSVVIIDRTGIKFLSGE